MKLTGVNFNNNIFKNVSESLYLLDWTDEAMVLKVQAKEITNYILKVFQ